MVYVDGHQQKNYSYHPYGRSESDSSNNGYINRRDYNDYNNNNSSYSSYSYSYSYSYNNNNNNNYSNSNNYNQQDAASASSGHGCRNVAPQKKERLGRKNHRCSKLYYAIIFHLCSFVAIGVLGCYAYRTQSALDERLSELSFATREYTTLLKDAREKDNELEDVHEIFAHLTQKLMSLDRTRRYKGNLNHFMDSLITKSEEYADAQLRLQREIQDADRRDLERRYVGYKLKN